ncbi:MAG: glyoxalase superfamily protein [Alphaproteobacteria bacterium]
MTVIVPSIDLLKREARRLRLVRRRTGTPLSHGAALQAVAHAHGFRNWNTLHAVAARQAADLPYRAGARVCGAYLGQAFEGRILTVAPTPEGFFRLDLIFDEPVDVVRFDSFSALRRRVSGRLTQAGESPERTSDGMPHLTVACLEAQGAARPADGVPV